MHDVLKSCVQSFITAILMGILAQTGILTFFSTVNAQNYRVGFEAGYNSYNLINLQQFERNISNQDYRLPALSAMEVFPNYYNYGISFTAQTERFIFGSHYNFHSTGSRYHYADYSGEVGIDSILKGHFIGLSAALNIFSFKDNIYQLYGGVAPNMVFGKYALRDYLLLPELNTENETNFTTNGFNSEFFLKGEAEFGRIILSLKAGYDITHTSKLYFEDEEVNLTGRTGESSPVNWSGIRTSLGIYLKLGS